MKEMVAFCGIDCKECPTYLAMRADDDEKRAKIAVLWSKQFNTDLKPEDISCDGCLSEGERLFSHCTVCDIKKCGKEKRIANCAYCDDYACDKLEWILKAVPDAKKRLDEISSRG